MNYGVDYSFQTQQNRNREAEIQNIVMGKLERKEEKDLAILKAKYDYNTAKVTLFSSMIRNVINEIKNYDMDEIASIMGVPYKTRILAISMTNTPTEANIRGLYKTHARAVRDYKFFNALWANVCQKGHCTSGSNWSRGKNLKIYLQLLDAVKDDLASQEQYERADTAAQQRGYENANDAQAIREVEIEWYFNLYGTSNPIEILAYQELERQRYGQTSYEAALAGTELIPINSPQQQEIIAAADPLVDQMLEDTAIYEAEQDRQDKIKKAILIAGGATLVGLFFWSRR
jgi:hypothetical protein